MKKGLLAIFFVSTLFILTSCGTYKGNYQYFTVDTATYGIDSTYAVAFPKGSSLVSSFNTVIEKMTSDGTLTCLSNYWNSGETDSCYNKIDFTTPIYNLGNVGNGQTLNIETSSGYPPFESKSGDGTLYGFDIDIAKIIAKELNYKLNWKDSPDFDSVIGDLTNDKIDVAIAAITPTTEREKSIDFSDVYFQTATVAITRDGDSITTLDGLKGKVVSAQSGTIQAQLLQTLKDDGLIKDFILYDQPATAMEALKTNKVDAYFVEQTVADNLLKQFNK